MSRPSRDKCSQKSSWTYCLAVLRWDDLAVLEPERGDDVVLDLEKREQVDRDPVTDPKQGKIKQLDLAEESKEFSAGFLQLRSTARLTLICSPPAAAVGESDESRTE